MPTALMGGSLPALGRFLVRRSERILAPVGLLYGLNTLGGAVGVLLAGFLLVERIGVAGSAYLAAALDVAVGAGAVVLAGARAPSPRDPVPSEEPGAEVGTVSDVPSSWVLGVAAIGGFCMLGYEVVWTRLLVLPMRSFAYSFSLMLALFLSGLVLGSLADWGLGRRVGNALPWPNQPPEIDPPGSWTVRADEPLTSVARGCLVAAAIGD